MKPTEAEIIDVLEKAKNSLGHVLDQPCYDDVPNALEDYYAVKDVLRRLKGK